VSVLIFMPGPAGMAHDATGLGLFSTCMHHDEAHIKTHLSNCDAILLLLSSCCWEWWTERPQGCGPVTATAAERSEYHHRCAEG
jgi:hypothetical protein